MKSIIDSRDLRNGGANRSISSARTHLPELEEIGLIRRETSRHGTTVHFQEKLVAFAIDFRRRFEEWERENM